MFGKKGGDGYEVGPGWAGMPAEASENVVLAPGHKVLNRGILPGRGGSLTGRLKRTDEKVNKIPLWDSNVKSEAEGRVLPKVPLREI